jgi:tetratricopeptide (TPR) repeat protein
MWQLTEDKKDGAALVANSEPNHWTDEPAQMVVLARGLAGRLVCVIMLAVVVLAYPTRSQQDETGDELRKKAVELYGENRFEQALPLIEELTVAHPQDAGLQEMLGACLLAHAVNVTDPEQQRQTRVRARQAFQRAKDLGDNSNFLQVVLPGIPEDGGSTRTNRPDVDEAMRTAEVAFTHGDLPGAIAGYAAVLHLDPKNYEAMLFTGDAYYKLKDYNHSCQWFDKAVNLDPHRETAYRYWGDALYAQGKDLEAKDKYVLAIVAEPYQKKSWVGLVQWAQRNHIAMTQPKIESPNAMTDKPNGDATIPIDPTTLGKKDGSESWILYDGVRLNWKKKTFQEKYPLAKEYRHSLAEETDALDTVATSVSAELNSKEIKATDLNPQLAVLIKLKQAGLIEPYVLLARPDQGISQDYDTYRKDHRDKLILYMNEYLVPPKK